MRTHFGNPDKQLSFAKDLAEMHAVMRGVGPVTDPDFERLSEDERKTTAEAIATVFRTYNRLCPEWRECDDTMARVVDEEILSPDTEYETVHSKRT